MANRQRFRDESSKTSYLHTVSQLQASHNLNTKSAQLVAKHNLVEAISAIRGTLVPVKPIGPDFGDGFKWSGGSIAPDGRIFFAPHTADHVLCINPFDGSVSEFGETITSSASINVALSTAANQNKFSDGVVGPRGTFLYLVPASSRFVIKVNLKYGTWVQLDTDLGSLDWKWGKGVLFGEKIFCSPHNSNSVLVIDCEQDLVYLIGEDYGLQSAKWGAPVLVPLKGEEEVRLHSLYSSEGSPSKDTTDNSVIICPPLNAGKVLLIDPITNKTCLVGDEFLMDNFKYSGACLGSDGAVYCAPSCATQFLRIEVVSVMVEETYEMTRSNSIDSSEEEYGQEDEKSWFDRDQDSFSESGTTLTQRMKNLIYVPNSPTTPSQRKGATLKVHSFATNPIVTNSPRPTRHHSTSQAKQLPNQSSNNPRRRSVTFHLDEEVEGPGKGGVTQEFDLYSKGILKKTVCTPRMCRRWPPDIVCSYHGAERIGNFKFGSIALSADGKAAIAVPMNFGAFLSIDTSSPEIEKPVRRIGPKLLSENLRFGAAVVGVDGYMYCSPLQATQVMRLDTLALSHHKLIHKHHHHHHHQKQDLEDLEDGDHKHSKTMHFSAAVSAHASLNNWKQAKAAMLKTHQQEIERNEKRKMGRKKKRVLLSKEEKEDEDLSEESGDSDDKEEDSESEEEAKVDVEAFPAGKAMLAIRVYVRWRRFAMRKARERQGYSASDRLIGNRDKHMRSLLLHEPDIWCFGLTLEDSSIPDDLCDWLEVFSATETGRDFIDTCGIDATQDLVMRVATLPNLMYSLIYLQKHEVLMRLPIIRKAIVRPSAFEGDWLVKCLASRKLMEAAVEYVELVSEDIHMAHMEQVQRFLDDKKPKHSGEGDDDVAVDGEESDDDEEVIMKNKTFEEIANIEHFVCPMLRLPTKLQNRIASTELMGAVLDELFTERPLALLVLEFDFIFLACLLNLLIRATWQVQHAGPLKYDEILVMLALTVFNFIYIIREYINYSAKKKLGLSAQIKPLDLLNMVFLFAIVGMSMNDVRLTATFILVAALTSGLCWLKLAGFLSVINLKFAVYIEALKIITRALRIYMITLVFFLAMFANMFFVIMKETGYGDDMSEESQSSGILDAQFTYVHTSFLTLFRMLCGDFSMEWFRREGDPMLTGFAVVLFVLYMIGVFIIMLNVLIAVVCDSYSVALSEAHEIFLRSRMHIVANLDMQGLTKLRNAEGYWRRVGDDKANSGGVIDYGAGGAYYGSDRSNGTTSERKSFFFKPLDMMNFHHNASFSSSTHPNYFRKGSKEYEEEDDSSCISRAVNDCFSALADGLDKYLKDSRWHQAMRKVLVIGRDLNFKESLGKSSQLEIDNENETMDLMKKIESKVKVLEEQQLLSENRIMRQIEALTIAIEQQSLIISRPPPAPVPPPPPPPPPPPANEPSAEMLDVLIKATQATVRETMKEFNKRTPVLMRPPTSPPPLMPSPRRGFHPRRSTSAKPSWAKGDHDP